MMSDSDEEITQLPPPKKHYCIKVGPSFRVISDWVQSKCHSRKARISKSKSLETGIITPVSNNLPCWRDTHKFSQRIQTVARHCMLRSCGLHTNVKLGKKRDLDNPPAIVDSNPDEDVNHDNGLSRNQLEAQWLMIHFDMLLADFYIRNQIPMAKKNKPFNVTDEMIVIDYELRVIWQIISTVSMTYKGKEAAGYHYDSKVLLTVNRIHFMNRIDFDDYQFMPPPTPTLPQDDDDDDDDDDEADEALASGMKGLTVK